MSKTVRYVVGYPRLTTLLIAFGFIGTLSFTRHFLEDTHASSRGDFWFEFAGWIACFATWGLLAPVVFRLEKRFPLDGRQRIFHFVALFLSGLVLCYAAFFIDTLADFAIRYAFSRPIVPKPSWFQVSFSGIAVGMFLYWSIVAVAYVIRKLIELQEREKETAALLLEKSRLEASLKSAQLETLRMRLNPHFLFNTLQNICVLTQQDPRTASRMLMRLGDLLRSALRRDPRPETPLAEEVKLTETYLAVEKMRFSDRLQTTFLIAPETTRALVPTLLLQPLVENAIKHGLRGVISNGHITISSFKEDGRLVITVQDNGVGFPGESLDEVELGIGLGSTCDRLRNMYPQENGCSVRRLDEGGTEVRLVLPFRSEIPEAQSHEEATLAHC